MQGHRLIDCQIFLASVRMPARCGHYSSPLDVREQLDLNMILNAGITGKYILHQNVIPFPCFFSIMAITCLDP